MVPDYETRSGSTLDRALLLRFMRATYAELYPDRDFAHLARTVEQHLSAATPLWFVTSGGRETVACLWMGTAIDQINGKPMSYIFLLYVKPEHRRKGLGRSLIVQAEARARQQGHARIGLQVFLSNQNALDFYHHNGFQSQSLWMVKGLTPRTSG